MKKNLYLLGILLLSACLSEKNADPGKPATFVRYFNGGNNDVAQAAEETSDNGIIILGTTTIQNDTLSTSKIKLIKTDQYGNLMWQKVYPSAFSKTAESLKGRSFLQLSTGGFLVIGEKMVTSDQSEMHILEVDSEGELVREKTLDFTSLDNPLYGHPSINGQAIQLTSSDPLKAASANYLVLGSTSDPKDNMILAELNKTDLSIRWAKKYGAGSSTLSNKIYLDGNDNVYWSGTVTRDLPSNIRLVWTPQNSLNTFSDRPIGRPEFAETGNDICRYGYGFAIVGSTNEKTDAANVSTAGDQDILFKIVTADGTELLSKSIPYSTDIDTGNSICTARGGVVVLGTVKVDGQDDYFLTKFDAFGNEAWPEPKIFGNKSKNDSGASVHQLSDGSLMVLGTTVFGNLNTIMLMKADSEGNIE